MGLISKPGTKYGPCVGKCKRKDCAAMREEASIPCIHCGKPIGYETKFHCDTFRDDGWLMGRVYSHFVCALKDAEAKRNVA
jgi:hypothetical protein